jgi:hypothetical protein
LGRELSWLGETDGVAGAGWRLRGSDEAGRQPNKIEKRGFGLGVVPKEEEEAARWRCSPDSGTSAPVDQRERRRLRRCQLGVVDAEGGAWGPSEDGVDGCAPIQSSVHGRLSSMRRSQRFQRRGSSSREDVRWRSSSTGEEKGRRHGGEENGGWRPTRGTGGGKAANVLAPFEGRD